MARPVRVDIVDGWYHLTARGIDRRAIFTDDRERRHFLGLLDQMTERYKVRMHAYVLMGNHYHLLIQTPQANASRAMQWLQVSYSMWFNRRHERVGPLFQGRFKSVPVDGNGSWALMASVYLHLNPVRTSSLGLNKAGRKAEGRGFQSASDKTLLQRLRKLRKYRWSSYRAYAGYEPAPKWLTTDELLKRGGGRREYRHYVIEWVTQGRDATEFEDAGERFALGAEEFREKLRRYVKKLTREQPDRRHLARLAAVKDVVGVVESELGKEWKDFAETYGDVGRDLVLYLTRLRCGLTLGEIGRQLGGLDYKLVSSAVERFERRIKSDIHTSRLSARCLSKLQNNET